MIARTQLEEAPKDIKRLEVLKPNNSPSMGERYDMAIAKERRLEVASQPEVSKSAKAKVDKAKVSIALEAEAKSKKIDIKSAKTKSKKNKVELDETALNNVEALEEEDSVKEGIDWSESEDDNDSE